MLLTCRVVHQIDSPDYSSACTLIEERISGAKRSLKITVSQARHTPQARWSDHPDAVPSVWGTRSDAMLSSQPSWASLPHLPLKPLGLSIALTGPSRPNARRA